MKSATASAHVSSLARIWEVRGRELRDLTALVCERVQNRPGLKAEDLAVAVLQDPACSVAFGYRVRPPARGAAAVAPPVFRRVALFRMRIYLYAVRRAFSYLAWDLDRLDGAIKRLGAKPARQFEVDPLVALVRSGLAVNRALDLGKRTRTDGTMDAALWFLKDVGRNKTSNAQRSRVIEYVKANLNAGLLPSSSAASTAFDPSVVFWAIRLLRLNEIDSLTTERTLEMALDEMAAAVEYDEAEATRTKPKAWRFRYRPANAGGALPDSGKIFDEDLTPELYSSGWRSDCMCLYNLALLRDEFPGQKAVGRMAAVYARRVSMAFGVHEQVSDDRENLVSPKNLAILAAGARALGTFLRATTPRSHTTKRTVASTVASATEINLAEHRAFGDYLTWRGGSEDGVKPHSPLTDLLQRYASNRTWKRPLNILLCASPGSGKSFFVKNLLRSIRDEGNMSLPESLIEVNLAHMHGTDSVDRIFKPLTSQIAEHGIGVLFLDEVDARVDGGRTVFPDLLMPLWDGQYLSEGTTLYMKRAIIFMAASVEGVKALKKLDTKGPDLASRISQEYRLPEFDGAAAVLTYLGNLMRTHPGVRFVERGALAALAERFGKGRKVNARDVEKEVQLMKIEGTDTTLKIGILSPKLKKKAEAAPNALEKISLVDLGALFGQMPRAK